MYAFNFPYKNTDEFLRTVWPFNVEDTSFISLKHKCAVAQKVINLKVVYIILVTNLAACK
ncbi:hypothetical protein P5673_027668 [Acropora cervicornis]|uniref:Uncharacterized protein n=1 Tax=Acropora cervicornis TaxID=6130 RepID=A0AAD9UVV2_ACRCE|nr:hypothetical protein P5673_027668 [Acropora cervicornis]